jgi:hypothetical protein
MCVLGDMLCLPEIKITVKTDKEGEYKWASSPGDDDPAKFERNPGYCARARLIQTDEKGQVPRPTTRVPLVHVLLTERIQPIAPL